MRPAMVPREVVYQAEGKIAVVTAPRKGNEKAHPDYWYEVKK